jgi:Big-like domain-containing protein/immunoglobulin I-set domain protein
VRKGIAGLSAVAIVASAFVGVLGVATATEAGAATAPVSLDLASGKFGPHSNPPKTLPATTTPALTGTENAKTGAITGASLIIPTQPENNTGTQETVKIYESNPGHAVATVNATGNLTVADTLLFEIDITFPLQSQCVTQSPSHVVLESTAPYDPSTQDVSLSTTTFTIAPFSSTNCGLAHTTVTARFSGSVGNVLTLDLHGPLAVPPPGSTTTATLTATPNSPQLAGTSVTLTATLTGTTGTNQAPVKTTPTTTATNPTGTMKYYNGAILLGTKAVISATTTFKTTALPPGTDQLTAVYSGGNGYAGSTSTVLAYVVTPKPSVTVNAPTTTMVPGDPTPTPFTVVVVNPATGSTWTHLILRIEFSGIRNLRAATAKLQYEDSGGGWCTLPGWGATGTIIGDFVGAGASCTPTYPASFSLAPGTTLTINLRIAYPTATIAGFPYGGTQKVTGTLNTGTCARTTTTPTTILCPAVAPLTGTAAPTGSGSFTVLPTTRVASKVYTTTSARQITGATVRQTFNVPLASTVNAAQLTNTTNTGLPGPTGAMTYTIDGKTAGGGTLRGTANTTSFGYPGFEGSSPLVVFSTATLSLGQHTLVASYPGDDFYEPSSQTQTFTVIPAPAGTPFTCVLAGRGGGLALPAYVTATGVVPPSTPLATTTGTFSATDVSVTLDLDPVTNIQFNGQTPATLGFSSTGSNATSGPITFTGTGVGKPTQSDVVGTWTGASTTIPVKKGTPPGTVITVGANRIGFVGVLGLGVSCTPTVATNPAPIGSLPVAGTVLRANPGGPVAVGTPVTLTSTVYPSPAAGAPQSTVQFYDGATPIGDLQPVSVNGTATVTVSNFTNGAHTLSAVWTGTPTSGITYNVSNQVKLSVGTAPPVITSQPASQAVNVGQTATFTAAASGTSPSVQWQVSTNGGGNWSTVPGATSGTLSVSALGTDSGNQYRAVFTNSAGSATTNAATLTVTTAGYWLMAKTGSVYSYGTAPFYGSMGGKTLNKPIVGTATTPGDGGYWLVASDGGIFSFGNAAFYGSMGGQPLNQPIVGIAATPDGKGYWEVASDGGIFAFGDAAFYGSMGGKPLNKPIVGIAATPDGQGYWEVASDGGIFAFGNAAFAGSTGSLTLNKPIVGMASTNNGQGYWLVAADGGVFAFGNAGFHGTVAGTTSASIVSITPTTDNGGYWETASNGQVFQFGDATSAGTALAQTATIVAMSD